MRCQIEKNKEILCDEIERLGNEKMTAANAAKLSAYRGAYKALSMLGEEAEERSDGAYYAEKKGKTASSAGYKESTPELDGDTEFERVIMKIPADREHMVKLTHIFDRHLTALRAVNAKPYNTLMEQLKELAKS